MQAGYHLCLYMRKKTHILFLFLHRTVMKTHSAYSKIFLHQLREYIYTNGGNVSVVHKIKLLPMGVSGSHPSCLLMPTLAPISSSFHCTFYVNILINLHMVLLATFTTGLIFVRWSKQGIATLLWQKLHIILNILISSRYLGFACNLNNAYFVRWSKQGVATLCFN